MKVSELFTRLSYGELSNLSMSMEASGTMNPTAHARLIQATNNALQDMFSRMHLLTRELLIESLDWKSTYFLRPEFAAMNSASTEPYKYILDTPNNLFTGDVAKVMLVSNEVGDILPLNDAEQWASVFTPHLDAIQLTHVGSAQVFSVTYQALHPKLLSTGEGVLEQDIRVPSLLEDMLCLKVAQGIFSPMSGQEFTLKAQQLEGTYESRIVELDQKNLLMDAGMSTNVKLHLRGFP